jgi:hypothetical protein
MKSLLDWLHFLPDKMSSVCEKAHLDGISSKKTMTNDVTPSYVAESTAFLFCSALIQRQ